MSVTSSNHPNSCHSDPELVEGPAGGEVEAPHFAMLAAPPPPFCRWRFSRYSKASATLQSSTPEVERGFSHASIQPPRSGFRTAVGEGFPASLLAGQIGASPKDEQVILSTTHFSKKPVKPHNLASLSIQTKYKLPINYPHLAILDTEVKKSPEPKLGAFPLNS